MAALGISPKAVLGIAPLRRINASGWGSAGGIVLAGGHKTALAAYPGDAAVVFDGESGTYVGHVQFSDDIDSDAAAVNACLRVALDASVASECALLLEARLAGAPAVLAISQARVKPATSVVLDPAGLQGPSKLTDGILSLHLGALLRGCLLTPGATLQLSLPQLAGNCHVVRTIPPSGILRVTEHTRVTVGVAIPTAPTAVFPSAITEPSPQHSPSAQESVARPVGLDRAWEILCESCLWPLLYTDVFELMNVRTPAGILLHGPPGVGKTFMIESIVRHVKNKIPSCEVKLLVCRGAELRSASVGTSEARLRQLFDDARDFAFSRAQSTLPTTPRLAVLFFDEIDALCPRREQHPGSTDTVSARLVTQLLTLMDGAISTKPSSSVGHLVIVAATNRVEAVDVALRRPGRFDKEIRVNAPNSTERLCILQEYVRKLPLSNSGFLASFSDKCVGFVGADLQALCREASRSASERCRRAQAHGSAPQAPQILESDFEAALRLVGPSALRSITSALAPTRWTDIGGTAQVVRRLREAIEFPLKNANAYRRMQLPIPRGVLLHGPPGNSKTTLVRALAVAVEAAFFSVSGADIMSPFVGEAEKTLRNLFVLARQAVPAIVFLDEIDAMVGKRGIGGTSDGMETGILATLLTELDGVQSADGIIVVGATNRPEALDPALLRPGRLELQVLVPLPDEAGRLEILEIHTRHVTLHANVILATLAARTAGWSGADLANLCREAAMEALRSDISAGEVQRHHFDKALQTLSSTKAGTTQ